MSTQCTGSLIGTGEYRSGTPYSELKILMQEGERVMAARGLEGEELRHASHVYARTMLHFYEQSGWQPLNKNLENEFVERVIAELAVGRRAHRSYGVSASGFNFGVEPRDIRMEGLDPFTPATFPDPDPHPHPKTPEEQVEPAPAPILGHHGPQDHGPQDHGPQNHGPQNHGPQHGSAPGDAQSTLTRQ